VKEKLTQVRLFEEIIVSESKVQRSQTTGVLMVTMKKVKEDRLLKAERETAEVKRNQAKDKIEKVKEANLAEVMQKKKKQSNIEEKIKQDAELDDIPDLE
jgi:hypothetical protein